MKGGNVFCLECPIQYTSCFAGPNLIWSVPHFGHLKPQTERLPEPYSTLATAHCTQAPAAKNTPFRWNFVITNDIFVMNSPMVKFKNANALRTLNYRQIWWELIRKLLFQMELTQKARLQPNKFGSGRLGLRLRYIAILYFDIDDVLTNNDF